MASVCLLDLFAKYLQQAGAHFTVKKTDRSSPQQEAQMSIHSAQDETAPELGKGSVEKDV